MEIGWNTYLNFDSDLRISKVFIPSDRVLNAG